jgi:hypothetical protein
MEMSPDIAELAAALAGFQGEMAPVAKTADNPFFKSKYADLASIVEAASPLASKHGLSVMQMPGWDGDNHTLSTVVLHTSGQWVRSEMVLMLPKQDPQGQGSALTYGRRYAYCAALGVVADADDDGNAAVSAPTPVAMRIRRCWGLCPTSMTMGRWRPPRPNRGSRGGRQAGSQAGRSRPPKSRSATCGS